MGGERQRERERQKRETETERESHDKDKEREVQQLRTSGRRGKKNRKKDAGKKKITKWRKVETIKRMRKRREREMDTNRKSERKGVRVPARKFASCTTIANK